MVSLRAIKGGGSSKSSCVVKTEKGVKSYEEFVVVGFDSNNNTTAITTNADALTLGMALILVNDAFNESMEELPHATRAEVLSFLRRK